MIPLPEYIRLVMGLKEKWVEFPRNESGDVVPTILVENDGRIDFIVHCIVPHPRRMVPYVAMLRSMLTCQALIVVHECRVRAEMFAEGAEPEAAIQAHLDKYEPGDFERLVNEGKAGEHGIMESMMVHRFDVKAGTHVSHILPFLYSGKGTRFAWLTSLFGAYGDDADSELSGDMIASFQRAMMVPQVLDQIAFTTGVRRAMGDRRLVQLTASVALERLACDQHIQVLTASHAWGSLLP